MSKSTKIKEFQHLPELNIEASKNIRRSIGGGSSDENYFGENARLSFFERYRWLSNQSKITLSDLRQPFDIGHLHFRMLEIPELDLHYLSNTDTPAFTGRQQSPRETDEEKDDERSFKGMIALDEDQMSSAGASVSTMSKQSSFFSLTNAVTPAHRMNKNSKTNTTTATSATTLLPLTSSSMKLPSRASTGSSPTGKRVYRYQAPPKAPKTPKSRISFPVINSAQSSNQSVSDNRSVASRRSYASNRSIRSSFSPGTLSNPTTNETEEFAFLNEFFLQNDDFASQDDQEFHLISPRIRFLASCMKDQINPRASLLLRKKITTKLDLKHQGMNDKMAKSFAKSLQQLPYLESINLTDNMLTDVGLTAVIQASMEMISLKELNLSQNKIGLFSAKALKDFLLSPNCCLETLVLSRSNIDDQECAHFIRAIEHLPSLTELDLSHNSVGKAEKVYRNTPRGSSNGGGSGNNSITGTQAIAELLQSADCKLRTLNLEWNMIRLDGATSLMKSLAFNQTLTYLNLSYNTLNTEAGIALGISIIKNTALESINLSYTSLDAIGCITVCAGIIQNRSLKKVVLDGNPIGDQVILTTTPIVNGCLLFAVLISGRKSSVNCHCLRCARC